MSTTFVATRFVDTVSASFTNFQYQTFDANGQPLEFVLGGVPDLSNPIDPSTHLVDIFSNTDIPVVFIVTFTDAAVSYANSTAGVSVDLETGINHGGFAEGDQLINVFEVTGSAFDDVIRGSNASDFANNGNADFVGQLDSRFPDWVVLNQAVVNNPGDNVLNGGNGSDVLEGRDGADVLNGGAGLDFASYETSPGSVTVRLPGATQTAIAQGADAQGDTFFSIEGLIGSRFNDTLTGNEIDNVLAGGLGTNVLNGMGGTDTADYSTDHFFQSGDTADFVNVHLGLNGASGSAQGFQFVRSPLGVLVPQQVLSDTLISIENVTGTKGNDTIVGNEVANQLDGRDGDDTLDGGFGNDTLIGGAGNDTASYLSHDASDPGLVSIVLGPANGAGSYTRSEIVSFNPFQLQTVETDTLLGIENVTGSNNAETITGNEQNNVLDGRGGNDILDGGFGNDTLIGGAGINTATYVSHDASDPGPVTIALGLNGADGSYVRSEIVSFNPVQLQTVETDVLRGVQNITGSNNAETIIGNEQNNVLDGRGGNDTLDGGLGSDTIIGGPGVDTVSYLSHDGVTPLVGEQDTVALGLNGADGSLVRSDIVNGSTQVLETDVLRSLENVTGSNNAETIVGNEQANVLDGRGGNDTLDGGLGNDTIIGGPGIDTVSYLSHDGLTPLPGEGDAIRLGLNGADGSFNRADVVNGVTQIVETDVLRGIENVTGSNAPEFISGNELDNVLSGRGGNDELVGGAGNDTLLGGSGDDFYVFQASLNGPTVGNDKIFDDSGNDAIFIDAGTLTGSKPVGNDLVISLTNGTIDIQDEFGTHPVETLVNGSTSLVLATGMIGGNGSGIISGTDGNDVMDGRGGDDILFGNGGNDQMQGGTGNDQLFGGAGNDHLDGGPGNDILNGGSGNNWLIGGAGNDTFVFTPEVLAGQAGAKQEADQNFVEDFAKGQDHIDLTAFHTTFADMLAPHHGQEAGPVTMTAEGHDTVLTFEGGGSVRIAGVTGLTAHDFLL